MRLSTIVLAAWASLALGTPQQQAFKLDRAYELKPDEGVFAYARISPDGRFLAYASQMPDPSRSGRITQTVTVVDLGTKKVLFTEPGIDAYWSNDGERMIYLSSGHGVSMRNHKTGVVTRNVAPTALGDYFSWAVRDGQNLILTIQSNYYHLDGDKARLPHAKVAACAGIGVGDRPLISKDGQRITTFVRGSVVVRGLTDCENTIDTGIKGQKADFSFDGRYIAFHAPKKTGAGYEIYVVDLRDRSVRTLSGLSGSSLYPSWTRDGRLSFRYDGDDYKGFMFASNVLAVAPRPLAAAEPIPAERQWSDLFPETKPAHGINVVMIWAPFSAHSPAALDDLQRAREYFIERSLDVGVMTALDPNARRADADKLIAENGVRLPRIALTPERFRLTEAVNQSPTTLLFRDGRLIDRRLGAQTFEQLKEWVEAADPKR
jgi:hypothetical protein